MKDRTPKGVSEENIVEYLAPQGVITCKRFRIKGRMGRRKTNLIAVQGNLNAQGYINQILQPEAVPFRQRHGPAILMHDNARPHVARICRQFLNRNNVKILPWPVVSPDMNPIGHIWDYLGRKIRDRGNVHNLRDLENALIQEWNNILIVIIRR